jgi:hypothetical protein
VTGCEKAFFHTPFSFCQPKKQKPKVQMPSAFFYGKGCFT